MDAHRATDCNSQSPSPKLRTRRDTLQRGRPLLLPSIRPVRSREFWVVRGRSAVRQGRRKLEGLVSHLFVPVRRRQTARRRAAHRAAIVDPTTHRGQSFADRLRDHLVHSQTRQRRHAALNGSASQSSQPRERVMYSSAQTNILGSGARTVVQHATSSANRDFQPAAGDRRRGTFQILWIAVCRLLRSIVGAAPSSPLP